MTRLTTNEVCALIHEGKLKTHKAPKSGWRIEEELVFQMFPDTRVEAPVTREKPVIKRLQSVIPTTLISDRDHYE